MSLEMHIGHLQKRITSLKALLDDSARSATTPLDANRLTEEPLDVGEDEEVVSASRRMKKTHIREVVEDHQHPLALSHSSSAGSNSEKSCAGDSVFATGDSVSAGWITSSFQLKREIESVCLDWRSLRNIKECVCSTPFDHFSKKVRLSYFIISLIDYIKSFCFLLSVSLLALRRSVLHTVLG